MTNAKKKQEQDRKSRVKKKAGRAEIADASGGEDAETSGGEDAETSGGENAEVSCGEAVGNHR